ncbi:MAG TPA: NYN domain-containing protein [Anaerolineae bacterium]|nr:NYN domain-containing protein [Anaerolineae bacterium]
MPYIIDGHNLIAGMPDIDLDDPDDEIYLIDKLRTYCARTGKGIVVYFDRRAPGTNNPSPAGGLTVHFVTPPTSADEAVRGHLRRLGREAPNWTVVSSDRAVQAAAHQAGAHYVDGPIFARQLLAEETPAQESEKPDSPLSEEEIAQWENLFKSRSGEN